MKDRDYYGFRLLAEMLRSSSKEVRYPGFLSPYGSRAWIEPSQDPDGTYVFTERWHRVYLVRYLAATGFAGVAIFCVVVGIVDGDKLFFKAAIPSAVFAIWAMGAWRFGRRTRRARFHSDGRVSWLWRSDSHTDTQMRVVICDLEISKEHAFFTIAKPGKAVILTTYSQSMAVFTSKSRDSADMLAEYVDRLPPAIRAAIDPVRRTLHVSVAPQE